jgi:hypothetical protein
MPLLNVPKVRKLTATLEIEEPVVETLNAYAAFINATADEVVNKALQYVFARDKDFHKFLTSEAATRIHATLRIKGPSNSSGKSRTTSLNPIAVVAKA